MRKPKIENKYNLKMSDIKRLQVIDCEALHKIAWRNNVISAWCISGTTAKNSKDDEFGCYNSFWIGFYDINAKAYAGKTRAYCSAFGDMCNYKFNIFFREKDIENEHDIKVQEMLLEKLNYLLDNKICMLTDN